MHPYSPERVVIADEPVPIRQFGDVVAPAMSCVVIGALLKEPWEPQLRDYLHVIYRPA
ncbi:hypothetical protein ACFXKF_36420 [Streptomyces scopuliridis]|uniref:hypothetical protein n=1 Tax=Streptomyces scopuliridis TaxID=452529 RepID=UPI0036A4E47A